MSARVVSYVAVMPRLVEGQLARARQMSRRGRVGRKTEGLRARAGASGVSSGRFRHPHG